MELKYISVLNKNNWSELDKLPAISCSKIRTSELFSPHEKILLLCRNGCSVFPSHSRNISIFHMAVWSANIAIILDYYENEVILCKYWDLYIKDTILYHSLLPLLEPTQHLDLPEWTNGKNAYLLAIARGNLSFVAYLHSRWYTCLDNEGNNDVIIAAKHHRREILNFLYKGKSNFKWINKLGENISIVACKTGQYYILKDYNICYDIVAPTIAAKYGHLECLQHYPDTFIFFETLCISIKYNQMNIISWILFNRPEFKNSTAGILGRTAYLIAAKYGSLECILFLEDIGVDITSRDSDGNTALMLAASHIERGPIVTHLCNKISINETNIYGETALDIAGSAGNVDIYTYLYHYDLKINPIPTRKINTKYVKAYCNICCIEDKSDFIVCKKHTIMHLLCWEKCKVPYCIYCFEKLDLGAV